MFYFLNLVVVTQVFSLFGNLLNCIMHVMVHVIYQLKQLHSQKAKTATFYIFALRKYLNKPKTNQFYKCHIWSINIQ